MTKWQFSYNLLQKRPFLLTDKIVRRFDTDNYEQKKWSFLPFGFFGQNLDLKNIQNSKNFPVSPP